MPNDIDLFQALVLAVVQGVTELFPVSSLGHAVILPHLFRWSIDQNSDTFLPFLVALHVGTALSLLVYFCRDWWILLSSLRPGDGAHAGKADARRVLLLVSPGTADHFRRRRPGSTQAAPAGESSGVARGHTRRRGGRRPGLPEHRLLDALLQATGSERVAPVRGVLRSARRRGADLR